MTFRHLSIDPVRGPNHLDTAVVPSIPAIHNIGVLVYVFLTIAAEMLPGVAEASPFVLTPPVFPYAPMKPCPWMSVIETGSDD